MFGNLYVLVFSPYDLARATYMCWYFSPESRAGGERAVGQASLGLDVTRLEMQCTGGRAALVGTG